MIECFYLNSKKPANIRADIPKYVAHISDDGKRFESAEEHLRAVSSLASEFAKPFGASSWAFAAGLAHDIGKYSIAFQKRILDDGPKVDHSTAGAKELRRVAAGLLSYCVAGHHGGLPNGGTPLDDGSTLLGRLGAAERDEIPDYRAFRNEIAIPALNAPSLRSVPNGESDASFTLSFLTRMIYSCLVDADFLCTELFMKGERRNGLPYERIPVLRNRLEKSLEAFYPPKGKVNEARCKLLDDCLEASRREPGVFTLTAPTGSGKTLAMLRFALNHACSASTDIRRVICAIPYTSIIEQNAQVYRRVLGEANVLEHHSSFDFGDSDDPGDEGFRMRLASENWDAPVVVTTNVKLFESLFASKPSMCRKLHNVSNSVILLDEAQMIPLKYLKPCIKALAELVKNYGCTVVLCTATQPCLNSYFAAEGIEVAEIASSPDALSESLARVYYRSEGRLSDKELVEALLENDQVLCIVNSRKQARALYDELSDGEEDGVFHLTTMMHAQGRRRALAKIAARVASNERCLVVATCLVEAGVDLDFPVVYRAVAGVDSLVQAAGRCNREGRRSRDESIVHLFISSDSYNMPREIAQRVAIAESTLPALLERSVANLDVEKAVPSFFSRLYLAKGDDELDAKGVVRRMSANNVQKGVAIYPFADVARDFKLIEEGSFPLVIPRRDNKEALERVRLGVASRRDWRMLSLYTVSIYASDVRALDEAGAIEMLTPDTYLLLDGSYYREEVGLDLSKEGGGALFW